MRYADQLRDKCRDSHLYRMLEYRIKDRCERAACDGQYFLSLDKFGFCEFYNKSKGMCQEEILKTIRIICSDLGLTLTTYNISWKNSPECRYGD